MHLAVPRRWRTPRSPPRLPSRWDPSRRFG
jgi:hypothetical protein